MISGLLIVLNSTLNSSLPSGAIYYITSSFNVHSDVQNALPISLFLIGYVVGPAIFSPLSEIYGRKLLIVTTFLSFMSWNLGCALAPSWGTLLFFRTMAGLSASAPITVVSGIYADIYPDPEARGKAITMSLVVRHTEILRIRSSRTLTNLALQLTTFGPVIAPAISGFVAPINWRWTFWISLIFSGCTLPFVLFLPGTKTCYLARRKTKSYRNLRTFATSKTCREHTENFRHRENSVDSIRLRTPGRSNNISIHFSLQSRTFVPGAHDFRDLHVSRFRVRNILSFLRRIPLDFRGLVTLVIHHGQSLAETFINRYLSHERWCSGSDVYPS